MTGKPNPDENFIVLKRGLQAFQQQRLKSTYADMLKSPEYRKMANFFFERLYSPEDFSFRDAAIKKLNKILKGAVYKGMASAMGIVIVLHEFTDALDERMVEKMIENGFGPDLTMDQYQEIYRQLDNYDERVHQIKLIITVTLEFHRLSKKWIVIQEGYDAFRAIKDMKLIAKTMEERELAWHDEIWNAGDHLPAKLSKGPK